MSIDFTDALEKYMNSNYADYTKNSKHTLKMTLKDFEGNEDKFKISYALQADYKDLTPKSNKDSQLKFVLSASRDLDDGNIGDITTYSAKVKNQDSDNGKGMTLAIIRIPSCMEVDFNSLERLQHENKVSNFEVLNGNTDVVLYWRSLEPGELKKVDLQMTKVYAGDL